MINMNDLIIIKIDVGNKKIKKTIDEEWKKKFIILFIIFWYE